MNPPVIRPSSLPALAKCPCYSPDQSTGETQKSEGTKRHTALGKYLADDPTWKSELGEWDADGVEWAGEYIRTHAPIADHPLDIEVTDCAVLPDLNLVPGTPDVFCGPVLFDLKGRQIDTYREQMDAYVLQRRFPVVDVHVLYATERRAERFTVRRDEAEARVMAIVEKVDDAGRKPAICDFCGWCSNRPSCPALGAAGQTAAANLGVTVPAGNIEDITDAAGLGDLKRAADAVGEWAKSANAHVKEMATKRGVIADGFRIVQRKGNPSISDAWAAVQAAGLPVESVARLFSISLPDLSGAYAAQHGLKEKAARADLESRLGQLIERGSTVQYLTPTN
jgi:hypothetical protein